MALATHQYIHTTMIRATHTEGRASPTRTSSSATIAQRNLVSGSMGSDLAPAICGSEHRDQYDHALWRKKPPERTRSNRVAAYLEGRGGSRSVTNEIQTPPPAQTHAILTMTRLVVHRKLSSGQLTAILAVSKADRRHSSRTGMTGPLKRREIEVRIVVLC